MELDDILSDKEPEKEPAAEAPKEPAQEAQQEPSSDPVAEQLKSRRKEHRKREYAAQGRDPETGQFLPKAEAEAEAPAKESAPAVAQPAPAQPAAPAAAPAQPEFTEREKAFLRTAEEERRKRQELERRMAQPQAPAQPQEPAKTFWDDPEGALARQAEEVRRIALQTRLQTAESIARSRHQDFDEKLAEFAKLATSVPGLAQQMLAAQDPAEFAYATAKNHMLLQQAGSLDSIKAQIEKDTEARVRAQIESEYKAKEEARAKELAAQRAALPGSLSDVRGATNPRKPQYTGPTPLADILKL